MKARCWEGCRAIIVGGRWPQDIGKQVTVMCRDVSLEQLLPHLICWEIKPDVPISAACKNNLSETDVSADFATIWDGYLMPITPDAELLSEEETQQEPVKA